MDKFRVQGQRSSRAKSQFPALKMLLCLPFCRTTGGRTGRDPERPETKDVDTSMKLLSQLGAKVERNVLCILMPATLMYSAHLTIWLNHACFYLGAGAAGSALWSGAVSLPGGCTIGARPVDLHISASNN